MLRLATCSGLNGETVPLAAGLSALASSGTSIGLVGTALCIAQVSAQLDGIYGDDLVAVLFYCGLDWAVVTSFRNNRNKVRPQGLLTNTRTTWAGPTFWFSS